MLECHNLQSTINYLKKLRDGEYVFTTGTRSRGNAEMLWALRLTEDLIFFCLCVLSTIHGVPFMEFLSRYCGKSVLLPSPLQTTCFLQQGFLLLPPLLRAVGCGLLLCRWTMSD